MLRSVCGEPCRIQICRLCASEDQLDSMADYSMLQTLRQVLKDDIEQQTETQLITLRCGHTFTVDTLDGHAGLTDYYEQSSDAKWKACRDLDPGFKFARHVRPAAVPSRLRGIVESQSVASSIFKNSTQEAIWLVTSLGGESR